MRDDLIQGKILYVSMNRMLKFGFRKVTMDEIAGDLGMSKNTIYKYFPSKSRMAEALFSSLEKEINHELSLIEESNKDPLEVISKSIFFIQQKMAPWFEHFLGDIRFELPEVWQRFIRFRNEKIYGIKDLIEAGIKKGKFRKINTSLAVGVYMGAIDYVLNPEFLANEKISFADALDGVLDIWSSGILMTKEKKGS